MQSARFLVWPYIVKLAEVARKINVSLIGQTSVAEYYQTVLDTLKTGIRKTMG